MSWDADLICNACGHAVIERNYTSNTSAMVQATRPSDAPNWLSELHGTPGPEGARLLAEIIAALEADPEKYRAMNPPNGWGSYDTLLPVLREMRDSVGEVPATWQVCR